MARGSIFIDTVKIANATDVRWNERKQRRAIVVVGEVHVQDRPVTLVDVSGSIAFVRQIGIDERMAALLRGRTLEELLNEEPFQIRFDDKVTKKSMYRLVDCFDNGGGMGGAAGDILQGSMTFDGKMMKLESDA